MPSEKVFRMMQITDTHLFADDTKSLLGVNTWQSFNAVLELMQAEKTKANMIIHTGDLSQDGSDRSYLRLADSLSKLDLPIYCVPGNHDEPEKMATIYPRGRVLNHRHVLIENWQIILLDSKKPGHVQGCLASSQLAYLQNCLKKYPDHYAIVVMHHQPVMMSSEWLDNVGLENAAEFWEQILPDSKVKAVIHGHVHQVNDRKINNIFCYAAPSTCIQFKGEQTHFNLENIGPGYRWLDFFADGNIETGIIRTATYIGTFDADAKGY